MPRHTSLTAVIVGEPLSPGLPCGPREGRPDLSQPGLGDLSPLAQVGFGRQIPPVGSKGLGESVCVLVPRLHVSATHSRHHPMR